MKTLWTTEDIDGGIMVSQVQAKGYAVPCMIAWHGQEPATTWGLTDLRDGMFMKVGDGSKLAIVALLNASHYVIVNKFYVDRREFPDVENRLGLPEVFISRKP